MNRITKMVFLTVIIFTPYYAWVLWSVPDHMLPYPWPGVIGLIYMPGGVALLVFLHKRLYRRELVEAESLGRRTAGSPGANPKIVWISSVEHLQAFGKLPWYAKHLGLLPQGFPKVKAGFGQYPLLYYAHGSLNLDGSYFRFSAAEPGAQRSKVYANLESNLRLNLTADELLSVTRFDMREVIPTALPLPFIRIRTSSLDSKDFLVCGSGEHSSIAIETEELWHALAALIRLRSKQAMK